MITKATWEKIAKASGLDHNEEMEFIDFGDRLANVENIISSNLSSSRKLMSEVLLGDPFNNMTQVARTSAQTIANDTTTAIQFNNISSNGCVRWSAAESERFFPESKGGIMILAVGKVQWASNGTGRRGIHIDFYNAAGSKTNGATMASVPPTGVAADTLPFSYVFYYNAGEYFKISVIQTSGGDLDMQYLTVSLLRVHWGIK